MQAFGAEGECLFDVVKEWRRLDSGYGELDGKVKHVDSLFAALHALADAMKTKSISVRDSLSATLEVWLTSGAQAPERLSGGHTRWTSPLDCTRGHVVDPMGLALSLWLIHSE